jgi:hypothetical protein
MMLYGLPKNSWSKQLQVFFTERLPLQTAVGDFLYIIKHIEVELVLS